MKDSRLGRVRGVLLAPAETFRAIGERPSWSFALALLVIAQLALYATARPRMDFAADYRDLMEARGEALSAESFERIADEAWRLRWVDVGIQAALAPVVYIAMGLLFWQVLRRLGAPRLSFSSSMAVVVHGFMPRLVADLLSVPVVLARDSVRPSGLRTDLLPLHLGALAAEGTPPAARVVIESVSIFSLWTLALLIIGYSIVARMSSTRAACVVLGAWVIYVASRAVIASIGVM